MVNPFVVVGLSVYDYCGIIICHHVINIDLTSVFHYVAILYIFCFQFYPDIYINVYIFTAIFFLGQIILFPSCNHGNPELGVELRKIIINLNIKIKTCFSCMFLGFLRLRGLNHFVRGLQCLLLPRVKSHSGHSGQILMQETRKFLSSGTLVSSTIPDSLIVTCNLLHVLCNFFYKFLFISFNFSSPIFFKLLFCICNFFQITGKSTIF